MQLLLPLTEAHPDLQLRDHKNTKGGPVAPPPPPSGFITSSCKTLSPVAGAILWKAVSVQFPL